MCEREEACRGGSGVGLYLHTKEKIIKQDCIIEMKKIFVFDRSIESSLKLFLLAFAFSFLFFPCVSSSIF